MSLRTSPQTGVAIRFLLTYLKGMYMSIKDMKRSNWPRVLVKEYVARDFEHEGLQGHMSLSVLRELTGPLTIHYPFGDVLIADKDFRWLQIALKGQCFWITAMYDSNEQLINLYFDITNGNCFDNPDNPCFEDMYLDIVAANNVLMILDQDELDEALENGDINRDEYDHAEKVCRELYKYLTVNIDKVAAWCNRSYRELKLLLP